MAPTDNEKNTELPWTPQEIQWSKEHDLLEEMYLLCGDLECKLLMKDISITHLFSYTSLIFLPMSSEKMLYPSWNALRTTKVILKIYWTSHMSPLYTRPLKTSGIPSKASRTNMKSKNTWKGIPSLYEACKRSHVNINKLLSKTC